MQKIKTNFIALIMSLIVFNCNNRILSIVVNDTKYRVFHRMNVNKNQDEIIIERLKTPSSLIIIESFSNEKDSFLMRKYETDNFSKVTYIYLTDTNPDYKFLNFKISFAKKTFYPLSANEKTIIEMSLEKYPKSNCFRLKKYLANIIGFTKTSVLSHER